MRKNYLKLLIILLLLSYSNSFAATFHAVIAGDTLSPQIGQQVQANLTEMEKFAKRVESNTQLQLNLNLLTGDQFDFEGLKQVLKSLAVTAEDVIIFYYAGQGFNAAKSSSWPTLTFKGQRLESKWVQEQLQQKKPKLLISLTDVGNDFTVPKRSESATKSVKDVVPDHYQKLFLQSQGYLLATSAHPEQLAGGDASGGFFTKAFLELVASESDWEVIARKAEALRFAMTTTAGRAYQQKPVVESQVTTKGVSEVVADPTARLLAVNYTYLKGDRQVDLIQDGVLHSQDKFKIHLMPSEACQAQGCYVHIVQRDSGGQVRDLFPWPDKVTVKNPIRTTVVLPAADRSYLLDERVGEETIEVFVSQQPFSERKGTSDVVPDKPTAARPCTAEMGCVSRLTFKHE